jgi:hypothetical protein
MTDTQLIFLVGCFLLGYSHGDQKKKTLILWLIIALMILLTSCGYIVKELNPFWVG